MALAKNTPIDERLTKYFDYALKAGVHPYAGSMIGEDAASGFARPLAAGDVFLGHSMDEYDNSGGADGDLRAKTLVGDNGLGYLLKRNVTGVVVTSMGDTVYASDDATLSLTDGGADSAVGKVATYIEDGVAVVQFIPYTP